MVIIALNLILPFGAKVSKFRLQMNAPRALRWILSLLGEPLFLPRAQRAGLRRGLV